jgi:hypothetical protein
MPMSPRLLRPISTTHPEAQVWRNAVIANGGTVSGSTLNAVSRFCRSIDAAGIRDRFFRLNLFAGTGLNACLVPLYRGQSRTGTQYGNTTDTNVNFVSGDYSESNGLQATADGSQTATKYLDTGLLFASLPSYLDAHISADYKTISASSITSAQWMTGGLVDSDTGAPQLTQFRIFANAPTSSGYNESTIVGGTLEASRANQTIGQRCHVIVTRSSSTSLANYRDGGNAVNITTAIATNRTINPASVFSVFAVTNQTSIGASFRHIISSYSMGASMTATQAADYYAAIAALRQALGRT